MHKSMFFAAASVAATLSFAASAQADNFAVTGSITVNGDAGDLPDHTTFGDSTYDPATGALSAGKFTFQPSSVATGLGTVDYQLTQTDTSSAQVGEDSTVVFTTATFSLTVTKLNGNSISNCVFAPITVDLAGTASGDGLDVGDRSFDIPPVAPTACSNLGAAINSYLAGSSNSIQVDIVGDFTPPADNDKIFNDGFDGDG